MATGKAESNPARDLKDALRKPMVQHFPAITDPKRLGELLRASYAYQGTHVVRAALQLMSMALLRPGELRQARWEEFDLDTATWTIPAARMKREKTGKLFGKPHLVPLAKQAVAILRDLHNLTGRSEHVFRGERHDHRPMSDAAINAALRAMGFAADEVTGHGFRATARTMLAERLGISESVIEAQLVPIHGPHTAQIQRHAHGLELGFCLLAFSIPSMPSWRKPRTFLIRPLGGSAIHLRFLSSFRPCWVCDLAAMAHKRG